MVRGVLIIGLGQIGMEYDINISDTKIVYSHSRAFSNHPNFELLGAVDTSVLKCTLFSEKYLKPSFNNISEALSVLKPKVIVIAAPTKYHKSILFEIFEHSLPEAILCEKPLSYSVEEASQMLELCELKGVKLFVNYIRRSDPGAINIRDLIHSGEIGNNFKGIAWYSKGLIHNGSHFFNLLEYWLGPCKDFSIISPGRLWQDFDPEPDVYVQFEKGAIAFMSAREESFSHYSIELISDIGRIRYEKGGELILLEKTKTDPNFPNYTVLSGLPEIISSKMECYQSNVVEQLFQALSNNDASICYGIDAYETMKQVINITNKIK